MHSFWLNDELLCAVLRYYSILPLVTSADLPELLSRRNTLTALALTCRLLYDPAMDILWSALESLAPLVQCISSDAWEVVEAPFVRFSLLPQPPETQKQLVCLKNNSSA